MGMWWSSNHWSTPMCASPSAPPPSSATPIFSRGLEGVAEVDDATGLAGETGVSCAGQKERHRQINAIRQGRMKNSLRTNRPDGNVGEDKSRAACSFAQGSAGPAFELLRSRLHLQSGVN